MKILNRLSYQAKKDVIIISDFKRHFLSALISFGSVILWELAVIYFGWPITLAIPFAILSYTIYKWAGFRGALFAALLVSLYSLYHFDWYGYLGSFFIFLGTFGIAAPSGMLKRSFREAVLEAEANQRTAELVDSLNGNIKRMIKAKSILDDLRDNWRGYTDARRFTMIEEVRGVLGTLLTLVESWQEINRSKELAYEHLNQMGGYPYRVDDAIKNIQSLQREILNQINYLGKNLEKQKEGSDET